MRLAAVLLVATLIGCRERQAPEPIDKGAPAPGDARRGLLLLGTYECNRCHEGAGRVAAPRQKSCIGCHRALASSDENDDWEIEHFLDLPTLFATDRRFRRGWVERFLREPHDLRPNMDESMPRLPIPPEDARDIAAHLAPDESAGPYRPKGDVGKGRRAFRANGCEDCHRFSGVLPPPEPAELAIQLLDPRVRLAPDLRHTRDRFLPWVIESWIRDPASVKSSTTMPKVLLTEQEVLDISAFVMSAPLEAVPSAVEPARLPLLERAVSFEEVSRRVFRRSCWHCHSDPDYAIGDGGPGNTGGLGFKGLRVNLAEHENVLAGGLDRNNRKTSLLRARPGMRDAPLIGVLLARQREVAGRTVPGLTGMPLGLPPLSVEDVQLVDSWIAQGAPE